jgi:proteasome accessory factor B
VDRLERLLNLVAALIDTERLLTAEEIAERVPGYPGAGQAFKRAFERDKEDLRDLGIPLETGTNSAFDDEPGYRIARRDYALPEITLTPDEAAAVGLAARMWQSATLGAAATRALRKLEAAGVEVAPLPEGLQPRLESSGEAFPVLAEAVHDGRLVRFDYRSGSAGEAAARTVEPWGLVWWHGRWYLVGHDRDRNGTRVFRLSRVEGTPSATGGSGSVRRPDGIDLTAIVASYDAAAPATTAQVRVRRGRGHGLRRQAVAARHEGDWDILDLPFRDVDRLADEVLPYGADAVVVAPADAVQVVVRRLRALAEVTS